MPWMPGLILPWAYPARIGARTVVPAWTDRASDPLCWGWRTGPWADQLLLPSGAYGWRAKGSPVLPDTEPRGSSLHSAPVPMALVGWGENTHST